VSRQINVRLGSTTEVELADADFRFTSESRHQADIARGPKSANNGHHSARSAAEIEDDFALLIADIASRILMQEIDVVVVLPKVLQ
jgi:hypothetical protein